MNTRQTDTGSLRSLPNQPWRDWHWHVCCRLCGAVEWSVLLAVGHGLCQDPHPHHRVGVRASAHCLDFLLLRPSHPHLCLPSGIVVCHQGHQWRPCLQWVPTRSLCHPFFFIKLSTSCQHCMYVVVMSQPALRQHLYQSTPWCIDLDLVLGAFKILPFLD